MTSHPLRPTLRYRTVGTVLYRTVLHCADLLVAYAEEEDMLEPGATVSGLTWHAKDIRCLRALSAQLHHSLEAFDVHVSIPILRFAQCAQSID